MSGKPTFDQLMTAKIAVLEIMLEYLISQQLAVNTPPSSVRKWADDFLRPYEDSPRLVGPEGLLLTEALREFLDRVVSATAQAAEKK